jgi:hypothetical protein
MYVDTQPLWVAPIAADTDNLVCKQDANCPAATHPECIGGKCYKEQVMSCGCKCANDKVYDGTFCNECVRVCNAGTRDDDSCTCKCDVLNTGMGGGFCEKPVLKCAFDGIATVDKSIDGGWKAKCTCPKDGVTNLPIATGRTCNKCVRKCQNGAQTDPESCTCRCPKSHSGEMCETCTLKQSDCQNGGVFDASTCKCTCGIPAAKEVVPTVKGGCGGGNPLEDTSSDGKTLAACAEFAATLSAGMFSYNPPDQHCVPFTAQQCKDTARVHYGAHSTYRLYDMPGHFKGFDCGIPAAANCFNGLTMGYQYVQRCGI